MYKISLLFSLIFCLTLSAEKEKEKEPISDIFNTKGFDFFKKNESKQLDNNNTIKSSPVASQDPLSVVSLKALIKVSENDFFAVLSYHDKEYFVRKGSKLQIDLTNSSALYLVQNISIDGVELATQESATSYMVQ